MRQKRSQFCAHAGSESFLKNHTALCRPGMTSRKVLAVILRLPRVESRPFPSIRERAYFAYVMSSLSRTIYTGRDQ